jgi:hypothetical protein
MERKMWWIVLIESSTAAAFPLANSSQKVRSVLTVGHGNGVVDRQQALVGVLEVREGDRISHNPA